MLQQSKALQENSGWCIALAQKYFMPWRVFSTINGWKAWQAYDEEDNKEDEFREVNFSDEFSEWIDKDILQFIENMQMNKHLMTWA